QFLILRSSFLIVFKAKEPSSMAKKKPEDPAAPPLMPSAVPMPGVPEMMPVQPQALPQAMPPMGQGNPMLAMMQMMQMMMGGGLAPSVVDPSAVPFAGAAPMADGDKGLDADLICPAR